MVGQAVVGWSRHYSPPRVNVTVVAELGAYLAQANRIVLMMKPPRGSVSTLAR